MAPLGKNVGLYLSIPFCRAKCSFCNFASGVHSGESLERYLGQLCDEIQNAHSWARNAGVSLPEHVDTIYFGGGTPSLLAPEQLNRLFIAIRGQFTVDADAEITLEAAPGQIADDVLEASLRCGVNRISLGVQSFVDREAQAVGRSHTGASCLAEFARLRAAGVRNLGADLIAGLPYQTEGSWAHSLAAALAAPLEHLSVYMLEVDEESRLGREVLGGGARLHAPAVASDELTATLYEHACEVLGADGLVQYEISNFARGIAQSLHNEKYWTRKPYLGLGLDAHSMLHRSDRDAVLRWANPDDLQSYAGSASKRSPETVSGRAAFEETIFLGLRRTAGLRWADLDALWPAWTRQLRSDVFELSRDGLFASNTEKFWLTARGRLVSGEIFGELLAGVSA